jgi:glyoxylase-like metal-dependent hydrolase (beta-lactamase superfamily II)
MPIKPENAGRYPKNWKEIRERILARAGNRCEGSPAFPLCRVSNGWLRNNRTGELTDDGLLAESWELVDRDPVTRIVLTIGHLDHTPENCAEENLRAWCQRCHLNYDLVHHQQNSYATRRRGRAAGDLFDSPHDVQ